MTTRLSVNLIDALAIIQGETYRELIKYQSIQLPGDWSAGTPWGQIRTDIIANSGTLLAEFLFESSTYDAVNDTTTLNPYLTDEQTAAIAPTTYKAGRTPSVRNCYVADFEIELSGEVAKVAYGFVQVIGEVTGGIDQILPVEVWDGGIDNIELTATNGLIKTYTIWGDAAKTINLGTFDVEDGNGIASTSYDDLTGILTITYADGTIYQTGDIRGEQGIQGIEGIQGIQGIQGEIGLSAYQVAVNEGFVGTEAQWLDSLKADLDAATIKTRYESNPDTNAYTDAEKTKLAGVEAGATADLTANEILTAIKTVDGAGSGLDADTVDGIEAANIVQTTGDQSIAGTKTFTTALILPNNSKINGVEHFYQTTKPTTRGDSSPLVAGDRWWKTDDGTEWFWNGTYWLSPEIRSFSHRFLGSTGAYTNDLNISASTSINIGRLFFPLPIQFGESILLSKFQFLTENISGDGVWTVGVATVSSFANVGSFVGNTVTPIAASVVYEGQISTVITKSNVDFILLFRAELSGTGSIRITDYGIYYHLIAP